MVAEQKETYKINMKKLVLKQEQEERFQRVVACCQSKQLGRDLNRVGRNQ